MVPSLYFRSPRPAVLELPHLITVLDAELMGKVVHLTRSAPGLWRLPAPYDGNDVYDPWRDAKTPFLNWALPANQAELLAPGRFATEALFGTQSILLDSGIDERATLAITETRARRKEDGGFYEDGLQDLPALPALLDVTHWALMPVAPDRSQGLFVTSPQHKPWVEGLAEWCGRQGRTHWRLALERGTTILIAEHAPEEARERAAAQEIDRFLARMGRYFQISDESLLPRIGRRIAASRETEQAVAASRQDKPGPGAS